MLDSYFSFSNILAWSEGIWGVLTLLFWSVTYILIVIAGFRSRKEKKVSMPYVAGVLNVAWEIAGTVYTRGNPGFIIWFLIDILIVFWGFLFLSSIWKKIVFLVAILPVTALFLYSFKHFDAAFLFSVYLIDVIMEIDFLVNRKQLSKKFMIPIASTKLLGDLFAGLTFGHIYSFVWIFALLSFICNTIYLIQCIAEHSRAKNQKTHHYSH